MDSLLLKKAAGGDSAAFEALVTPLESMIWRVCWHYTGNSQDASDCGQEAMIRIWRALKDYHGDAAFESWCYRIAANCCLDFLRKKKRKAADSLDTLREEGYDPPDTSPGTEEKVLRKETHRQLREAIALLPEEQRDALVLTQLENVSYEEAAGMLDISQGTLKSRVNRAKQKLREILSGSGEPFPVFSVKHSERRYLK